MTELKNNIDRSQEEISLRDIFLKIRNEYAYLKRKWLLIILAGIIGGLIGFISMYSQKTIYTATLSYALEDEKAGGGMGNALGLAGSLGIDIGSNAGGAFGGSNLMELMHSRSLIEKTLLSPVTVGRNTISLADFYIMVNEEQSSVSVSHFAINANRNNFTRAEDSILGNIYNSIDKSQLSITQKDKKVSIGTIEVKSVNELFAKSFCEALSQEVSEFYVESKSKKAKLNVTILERQTDSIRSKLYGSVASVAMANDNTYNLNPAFDIKRTPSITRQIDVQANTIILTQLIGNLEMARVTLRKETPLFQIIDRPIFPLPKERASRIKAFLFGSIIAGLFSVVIILGSKWYRQILK